MTTAKKINVWFLSGWYPSRVHTTRGNFVQKHAEAASRYCNVAVLHVCTDPGLKQRQEVTYSVEKGFPELIIYLNPGTGIPGLNQLMKYFRFRRVYKKGSRLLQKQSGSPDFIHSSIVYPVTFFARMLARKFRISYGIEEHWTGYLPADPLKPSAFSLWISKKFVKKAAVIMPDSADLGENMQKLGLAGHYITLTNVVDTQLFKPQSKPTDRKEYRLLHISTLHPVQKNFDGLLRSLHQLKELRQDFCLEVVSDGDYNEYHDLIKTLGLTRYIRFHGKMKTGEIAALAAQCDVLVLFSRYENFPCVIPEALSAGIPVLTTRVGGIHEHVLPPLGRMVETEDEQAFSKALDDMLHHLNHYDPQELHKYAETHFSYEAIGKKLLSIYQQYIHK